MKISTKGRYALRLMLDIAQNDEGNYISLRDISQRQGISVKYMEQIVIQLTRAGLLRSVRGPQGGYRLVRAPEDYPVGEILRVTEGSLAPVACLDGAVNQCTRAGACPTVGFWMGLDETVSRYVDGVTLRDLLAQA